MIEMNAVAAGTELDAARDAGREGASAGRCAWSAGDASLTFSLVVRPDVNMHAFHGLPFVAAMGMMDALAYIPYQKLENVYSTDTGHENEVTDQKVDRKSVV